MSAQTTSEGREAAEPRSKVGYRSAFSYVRKFWPLTRPHARYVWTLLIFTLLGMPLSLVSPWIVKHVIDMARAGSGREEIGFWALVLIGMTALSVAFGLVIGYCSRLFHNKVSYSVRLRLYRHLQKLPLRFHTTKETGYLMSRLDHDVSNLNGVMADAAGNAAIEALKAAGFLVMLFVLQPFLAAGGCLLIVVVFGAQLIISRPLRRRNTDLQESRSTLSQTLHQSISGHYLVQATASESREAHRFAGSLGRMIRAAVRRDMFNLWANHAMSLITGVAPTLIILAGAFLILEDRFTVGGLFAFFLFLVQLAGSIMAVARYNPALQASVASLQRVFEILETEPEVADPAEPRDIGEVHGEVVFENVHFAYDEGRPVLQDISLHVEPNTTVALVGPSGAGKSTLVNLVPRFYDPTEGRVLVDGVDLRELGMRRYRESVGVVPQDVFLFDRTVGENIAFGSPHATEEEIRSAAAAAHAVEFIDAMPAAFDTVIGERGVRLSGGQRQRLAIAREILRNPTILILDEATSSLDSQSERLIQAALATLLENRTSFVIAHRLSTVTTANTILVMDEGRIVERGTHAELLGAGGLYSRLCSSQAFLTGEEPAP